MVEFEHSIFINRPQQEVFDYVINPANYSKWQSSVESAKWTSEGPVGVGSTWTNVSNLLGRKIEAEMEVTSYDHPKEASAKAVSGPVPFEATFKFASKGDGTQLTISSQAEVGGFFKLAEGLVAKQLEKQVKTDFTALKLLMEKG